MYTLSKMKYYACGTLNYTHYTLLTQKVFLLKLCQLSRRRLCIFNRKRKYLENTLYSQLSELKIGYFQFTSPDKSPVYGPFLQDVYLTSNIILSKVINLIFILNWWNIGQYFKKPKTTHAKLKANFSFSYL